MKITNKTPNKIFILLAIGALAFILFKVLNSAQDHNITKQVALRENIKVMLYVKKGCSYCSMAEELLTENKITYETVDLSFDLTLQKKLVDKTGQVTVPYVFINNEFIGGYNDLLKPKKEKKL
jgi:glutaredoxin 3